MCHTAFPNSKKHFYKTFAGAEFVRGAIVLCVRSAGVCAAQNDGCLGVIMNVRQPASLTTLILFPGGNSAANMPFGLVFFQNSFDLVIEWVVKERQTFREVFVYG